MYLKMGYTISKIDRAVEYYEYDWVKPYIDECVSMRNASKTKFEKDFYKLCMNSVFGKTMENVRNRQKIRLVTDL